MAADIITEFVLGFLPQTAFSTDINIGALLSNSDSNTDRLIDASFFTLGTLNDLIDDNTLLSFRISFNT
jgi:hypothetical protein